MGALLNRSILNLIFGVGLAGWMSGAVAGESELQFELPAAPVFSASGDDFRDANRQLAQSLKTSFRDELLRELQFNVRAVLESTLRNVPANGWSPGRVDAGNAIAGCAPVTSIPGAC